MWGNSWRLISLPVLLVFTEAGLYLIFSLMYLGSYLTALYITSAVIDFGPFFHTQVAHHKSMSLEFPGLLIGFGNTTISALLIFYRIYSVSRNNSLPSSGRQYTRILYILTESSALYVIGVLLYAIPTAFPITDANVRWQQGWTWYSNPIFSFSSVRTIAQPQRIWLLIVDRVWLLHLWWRAFLWLGIMMCRRLRQGGYPPLCFMHEACMYTSLNLSRMVR